MALPAASPRPTQVSQDESGFREFAGIVNTLDAKEIGNKALRLASNVEIDDRGRIVRRNGSAQVLAGAISAAYATHDQSKLYVVLGTDLVRVMDDFSTRTLQSGLSGSTVPPMSWSEDPSNYVAYTNGLDSGIIRRGVDWVPLSIDKPTIVSAVMLESDAHQVLPFHLGDAYTQNSIRLFATYVAADGRESAPSDIWNIDVPPEVRLLSVDIPPAYAMTNLYCTMPGGDKYYLVASSQVENFTVLVHKLLEEAGPEYPYTVAVEPVPSGAECHILGFYDGRMFIAEYIAEMNISVVWFSLSLQYHLFDKTQDYFTVIGDVVLLLAAEPDEGKKGLIIGTDNQIYGWDGERLTEIAQYGVVPGACGDVTPDGVAYFWTLRGIAKAFPYELVTEQTFSGDPGVFNHARIFYERGYAKLVASTIAGNPVFNQRSER